MYLSVAAAAIYMASQASEVKKTQKGTSTVNSSAREWAGDLVYVHLFGINHILVDIKRCEK